MRRESPASAGRAPPPPIRPDARAAAHMRRQCSAAPASNYAARARANALPASRLPLRVLRGRLSCGCLAKKNVFIYGDAAMAITFHPNPGTVLICDFNGLIIPEMVKTRPVVVISPRLRHRTGLCTIIPLSTTPPDPKMPWHWTLSLNVAAFPQMALYGGMGKMRYDLYTAF